MFSKALFYALQIFYMKSKLHYVFFVFLILLTACNTEQQPAQKFIETKYFDSSIKPGDDFFDFVNGKWLDTAKIPATESGIGAAYDLFYRTRDHLHEILDSVSKGNQSSESIEQKVGDFYASGMDSATIENRGYDPVKPYLQKIDSIKTADDVLKYVNELQLENDNP